MVDSRSKGAQFEREVAALLRDELGEVAKDVRRNLTQYQVADEGDMMLPPFMIECKRYAKGDLHQQWWWEKILKAAGEKYIPLLIYRFDRRPIRMVFPLHVVGDYPHNNEYTCTVGVAEGMMIIREVLSARAGV
jgi:Holliday junction resolvase